MNPFKLIYSSLYYDFKKRGDETKARANGTLISAIMIFLLFFLGFLLGVIYYPNFEKESTKFLIGIINDKSAIKGLSSIFLVMFFILIHFLVKRTIGTQSSFNRIIEEFLLLTPEQQKGLKKRATPYFLTPILLFIITMIVLMNTY